MKSTTVSRKTYPAVPNIPYPNAASRRELFSKFLDILLAGAIGAGAAAALLFLITLA